MNMILFRLIQVLAAMCSYLVISLPFAGAFQVSIFASDGQSLTGEMKSLSDYINKGISYPYEANLQYIRISLSVQDPSHTIRKVYLYRCKNYNPVQCIQNGIEPVVSVSPANASIFFDEKYKWNDVSLGNTANLLTMVKLDVGGVNFWVGSWDKITETGIRVFERLEYDPDGLNVYLKSGVSKENVKSYIETNQAIPMGDIDHVVFPLVGGSTVSKLYELTGNQNEVDPSGTTTPSFSSGSLSGNSFNGSSKNWAFIMAGNGKTSNPVPFYSEVTGPSPCNNDGICSGQENYQNCPSDCPPSGASLVIDNWNPQVVTCGSQDEITVSLHAENATFGYFQGYHYTIDNIPSQTGGMTCFIVNPSQDIYTYQCTIPVSNFPACNAPGTSTIKIFFNYTGGQISASFPITLNLPLPSLVVNSVTPNPFDCGLDTELTSQIKVNNEPQGTAETHYTFDGVNFNTLTCSQSGGFYSCVIGEQEICQLLQEKLSLKFNFKYNTTEVLSGPIDLFVNFPPPSMGIDTVTPQSFVSGENKTTEVMLHVNYPDSITYTESDFKYKYLDNPYQTASCALDNSFSNIKYYRCSINLAIPLDQEGVKTLSFRLDGYKDGQLTSLTANTFIEILSPPPEPNLRITSTSSPLRCIQDSSLIVQARVENIQGAPSTYYTAGANLGFNPITCSQSGNVFTCSIPKNDLCSLMSNSLTLTLKFAYPDKELLSNPQNVYIDLPEPHMQVYSIYPDKLVAGETTSTTVSLYIQYPETVGVPSFTYSYLDKVNQQMGCNKVSSTNIKDFYDCPQTAFEIPSDFAGNQLSVVFKIEGTTLSYPFGIPVTQPPVGKIPWLQITSTSPARIEVKPGNETSATFYVTVHNAVENELAHQVSLTPNNWITQGSCEETQISYDFKCNVTVRPPVTATQGANTVVLNLRAQGKTSYDLSNQTTVYVLPEEKYIDIQSVSPETLYCEGQTQQNPDQVRINARLVGVSGTVNLLEEQISFNNMAIPHTARYCTVQGTSILCNIPTDKFFEKVNCGQGELAPGEGSHYYPVYLNFLLRQDTTTFSVTGSRDLAIQARPLEPFLEIADDDIEGGWLRTPIKCLSSSTIKLGEGGNYVRIKYADLLHPEPKGEDLEWSFRLDAQDYKGKLTKGAGSSPETNATVCKFKKHQKVGVHRIEDYECSFYLTNKMFQRCARGEGTVEITATSKSTGKTAKGGFKVYVRTGREDFDLYMDVEKPPISEIGCQINDKDCNCQLDVSQLNTTVSIKNRGSEELTDLVIQDQDITFERGEVDISTSGVHCRPTAKAEETNRFICGFTIGPSFKVPGVDKCEDETQTFGKVGLGDLNLSLYVKYANNLMSETLSEKAGSVKVQPKLSDAYISLIENQKQMNKTVKAITDVMKGILKLTGFCVTCSVFGNLWELGKEITKKSKTSAFDPNSYKPETGRKIGFQWYESPEDVVEWNEDWLTETQKQLEDPTEPNVPNDELRRRAAELSKTLDEILENSDKKGGPDNWAGFLAILGFLLAMYFLVYKDMKDAMGDENEYFDALKDGIKWGMYVCLGLYAAGLFLSLFKDKGAKGAGKIAIGAANVISEVCNWIVRNFQLIFGIMSIMIKLMLMKQCFDMMQRSSTAGYYGTTYTGSQTLSTVSGIGAGIGQMNHCLQYLTSITQDVGMMSFYLMQSTGGLLGRASMEVYDQNGNLMDRTKTWPTCEVKVVVKNWCKAIRDDQTARNMGIYLISTDNKRMPCGDVVDIGPNCQGWGYQTQPYGGFGYQPTYSPYGTYPYYGGMYGTQGQNEYSKIITLTGGHGACKAKQGEKYELYNSRAGSYYVECVTS